jgi:RNA-directed DNA polymerase
MLYAKLCLWPISGRFAEENRKRRGGGKPETFDFLGFKHISGKNRMGRFTVRRTTIRKRMGAKLQELKQELHKRMHDPVSQTGGWLRSVVQGYSNYYAVLGNLTGCGKTRFEASTLPQDSLVSTRQPDKK